MTQQEREVVDVVLDYAAQKTLWENAMFFSDETKRTPEKLEKKPYDFFKTFDMGPYEGMEKEQIREKFGEFFDKYTTPKKRVYSGQSPGFGFPAQFQGLTKGQIQQVEFVSPSRCEVVADVPTGFKKRYKFVVLKKNDGWRIDSLKTYRKSSDKWENDLL